MSRRTLAPRPRAGLLRLLAVVAVGAPLAGCGGPDLPSEIEGYGLVVETARLAPTLRLFNFPDYLDPALAREFRERYGVRIVQDYFDTNEAMMARLRAGAPGTFDLVVASDYAVSMLAESGLLAPLDPALLPNRANLHPDFTGLPYDPDGRYSVPYQWGTTGIGIRVDRVGAATDAEIEALATWGVLFDPARTVGRFALLDDPRESIGAALLYLGHSVNTTDPAHLARAEALLAGARDRAVAFTPATTGRDLLVAGEVDVSHNHSGDIAVAQGERSDVAFLVPREGAVIWADNLVIPAGGANAYTAHVFINFLLDAENGARLTEEIRYLSPNRAAWTHLPAEIREEHEEALDPERLAPLEFIADLGAERRLFDQLWTRVKAGGGR
jgi:spermidine/putrescine transport system substrate-binding protein